MASLVSIYRRFPTREAAVSHLEAIRWPDGPICPYCQSPKASRNRDASRNLTDSRWQCQACKRSYSVTVGTIFHKSHIDLQRWFLLASLMLNAKKGLSSLQAARDLEMRQPTVWSMMHRIRAAMSRAGEADVLTGLVEMDETYIGGKPRKPNDHGDGSGPNAVSEKIAVVGAVERGGRFKAKVVDADKLTQPDMLRLAYRWFDTKAVVHTDEYAGYRTLGFRHVHRRINHAREYVGADLFTRVYGALHTNTIESMWAVLERAIMGQFHHVSRAKLGAYVDEIAFKRNHRGTAAFAALLLRSINPLSA
jgi:transposase-like protein